MFESRFVGVGVDGCPGGWFSFGLDSNKNYKPKFFTTFKDLLEYYKSAELILVDIPIGLPDGREGRCCDKQARKLLNEGKQKRGSTVFPTPVRAVVEYFHKNPCCEDVIEAVQCHLDKAMPYKDMKPDIEQDVKCEITKQIRHAIAKEIQLQITGKSLSKQTLEIAPKIAEVDALLPRCEGPEVREIHPEICFFGLNRRRQPMQHKKSKKEGEKERLEVLQDIEPKAKDIFKEACKKYLGKVKVRVEKDDILDALVAIVTANILSTDKSKSKVLPKTLSEENPKRDSKGLRMEMIYCQP